LANSRTAAYGRETLRYELDLILVDVFPLIFLAASVGGAFYLLIAMLLVRRFVALPRHTPEGEPPVTILKPLCGAEPFLYENLLSFCKQNYAQLQVVFGVRDVDDAAIAIARRIIGELPGRDLTLVVDPAVHGTNFKISNVMNMMPSARHDILIVADSDMSVSPDYVRLVVGSLQQPSVGLVTCLYTGRPTPHFWSRLGAMFVNHVFLPAVLVGGVTGQRQDCFGATMALTRDTLKAIGGFEVLKDHLADDHDLGAAVAKLGHKIALAPEIVGTVIHEPSATAMLSHELRWARTTRMIEPVAFAASILMYPMQLAVIGWLLSLLVGSLTATATGVVVFTTLCRAVNMRVVNHALKLPRTPFWMVPLRDVLSLGTLVASYCVKTVTWRGRAFRVESNGHLKLESLGHDENLIPAPPVV
jgi:ceramide glucosyltransferase